MKELNDRVYWESCCHKNQDIIALLISKLNEKTELFWEVDYADGTPLLSYSRPEEGHITEKELADGDVFYSNEKTDSKWKGYFGRPIRRHHE